MTSCEFKNHYECYQEYPRLCKQDKETGECKWDYSSNEMKGCIGKKDYEAITGLEFETTTDSSKIGFQQVSGPNPNDTTVGKQQGEVGDASPHYPDLLVDESSGGSTSNRITYMYTCAMMIFIAYASM